MSQRLRVVMLLLSLILLSAFLMGIAPQNQYPPGGGSGGSCTYCSSPDCGCDPAPAGCVLQYSCGCSSIDCNHACSFRC